MNESKDQTMCEKCPRMEFFLVRKNSVFGHFSRSETTMNKAKKFIKNFIKKTLVKKSIFLRKSAFAERAVMFLKNRKKYFS